METARGRLVRLFDVEVDDAFAYYLTWHIGAPLSRAGEAFRDCLRSNIRETGNQRDQRAY